MKTTPEADQYLEQETKRLLGLAVDRGAMEEGSACRLYVREDGVLDVQVIGLKDMIIKDIDDG